MRVGHPTCFLSYLRKYESEIERPTTPCLLGIDTRIIDGKLVFYVMYRSWDLLSGYPTNMGGFQLLKEYMADMIDVGYGPTYAFCKDLHLYEADLGAVRLWI